MGLACYAAISIRLFAADGGQTGIPALAPPRGEIPPTFWEQHGALVVAAGILGMVLVAGLIWWITRPRPRTPVPIEIQTRAELERLQTEAESGELLSRVSQTMQRYVLVAYDLPLGELTTAEFCRLVQNNERIGKELTDAFVQLFRECDERKFSPARSIAPLGAVGKAFELLSQSEARRNLIREREANRSSAEPVMSGHEANQ